MAASTVDPLTSAAQVAPTSAPVSVAPRAPVATLRPRLALGVVVVLGVMALQLASDAVAGKESARLLARLIYMGCELPLLMVALTAAFRRSIRGATSATQGLAIGVGIATAFGVMFGLAYGAVALRVPALRLTYPNGVSLVRTSLFGVLSAQLDRKSTRLNSSH